MRYLLLTYARQPNGQIDEQAGVAKNVRDRDLQTCNVIMDYRKQEVIKCSIDGRMVDTDFQRLNDYYAEAYPSVIHQLRVFNKLDPIDPDPVAQEITSQEKGA